MCVCVRVVQCIDALLAAVGVLCKKYDMYIYIYINWHIHAFTLMCIAGCVAVFVAMCVAVCVAVCVALCVAVFVAMRVAVCAVVVVQ